MGSISRRSLASVFLSRLSLFLFQLDSCNNKPLEDERDKWFKGGGLLTHYVKEQWRQLHQIVWVRNKLPLCLGLDILGYLLLRPTYPKTLTYKYVSLFYRVQIFIHLTWSKISYLQTLFKIYHFDFCLSWLPIYNLVNSEYCKKCLNECLCWQNETVKNLFASNIPIHVRWSCLYVYK